VNVLLQLFKPYLTPIEADEIRSEIAALNPKVHLVMPDWPWLEVRGVTEKRAAALLESLRGRGMKFHVIEEKKKARAAA
jgi:hypothetical protein